MTAIFDVNKVSLSLDGQQILNNISCIVPFQKITTIIGPSGAGKSSMLRCFNRLYPFSGEIRYQKQLITNLDVRQLRREVVYVSQVPVVFPGTVKENINWGPTIWEEKLSTNEIEKLMEKVGLDTEFLGKQANTLSVGQQQRLHLARSLAIRPKVLLLDEPASALDAISKDAFERLIHGLMKEGNELSVVMVTHDLNQARRIGDYAILINNGEVILQDYADIFFEEVKDLEQAQMLEKLLNSRGEGS